ncbi:MAG TPA: tripartite tricarboxylate transporter substrate binding protein, partial [Burkholderiales bacterium]|nr:tripartite tricarboxylate transporter substrate binding protein [Burkholderiales bacterium]
MTTRRSIGLFVSAVIALHSVSVFAQVYPSKVIRVIIPAAPGDSCDVLARLVGQKVGERLGQQLAVDNRPGAGGQLGL